MKDSILPTKSNRLRVSKINYVAIHEINHLVAGIIYFIELGFNKEQIKASVQYIVFSEKEKSDNSLGCIYFNPEILKQIQSIDFICISGCVGSYYYFYGTSEETELDKSHSDDIREFIIKTGGEEDLVCSGLDKNSLRTNYKLKKLVQKIRLYCNDEDYISLITCLAKRLKNKKKLGHKDIKNFINSNFHVLENIVERNKEVGIVQRIKNKLSL